MEDLPLNWDPEPERREWWRNTTTNDRGYKVRRNGVDRIRLDRPNQEIVVPFKGSQWTIDRDLRPLMLHTVARLAHQANQALLRDLGYHDEARAKWEDLPETERIRFMRKGPEDRRVQNNLFEAIMSVLEPLTK